MNNIEVLEIECKRLQKKMETNEAFCKVKSMEIEKTVREIEFNKSFIAERAKEVDLKQKKIDDSITYLEVKKRKFTEERNEIKGIIYIYMYLYLIDEFALVSYICISTYLMSLHWGLKFLDLIGISTMTLDHYFCVNVLVF